MAGADAIGANAMEAIESANPSVGAERAISVTMIQRFDSALNLNVHFHMLILDGVYSNSTVAGLPGFVEPTERFIQLKK